MVFILSISVLFALLVCVSLVNSHSEGFTLGIRDSIMVAHSFTEEFGPAHGLHGATYTVDVEFASKGLV